jgi:hypothetical protein
MLYVLIASHGPEICPTSNAATRKLMQETGADIPAIAEKSGVTIVAGPYVNREHVTVAVVEAKTGEDLDAFLMGTRLPQWNSVRVLPSLPLQDGIKEIEEIPAIY